MTEVPAEPPVPLRSTRRAVATTAGLNIALTCLSAGAGLLIARTLGPNGRGQYAAVVVWFGMVLVAGELGQPAAITYFVASQRQHARDYVATSRVLMLSSGLLAAAAGWMVSPELGRHQSQLVACYRVMFVTCVISFVSATYVFALQATNLPTWNIVRASQPVLFFCLIGGLQVLGRLTLSTTVVTLSFTVFAQTIVAYWMCRRAGLLGGRIAGHLAAPLLRYGSSQIAANAPTALNSRLDQIILSSTASYQSLGVYAVAVSVTSLGLPAVSAIGYVLFPRIAAQPTGSTAALERRAIQVSMVASLGMMLIVSALAPWVIPLVFGRAYSEASQVVWILAFGGLFLASGSVMGDLLRGRGQPLAVAVAQGFGAVVTVSLLLILLPIWGIRGAAVSSSAAYLATFIVLFITIRRPVGRARSSDRNRPSEAMIPDVMQ